jgi:hypothetical protein
LPATLITGAAGNLGGLLAQHLVAGGHQLRLMHHRRPLPDSLHSAPNVQAVQADLADPETLHSAVEGVDVAVHFAGVLFSPRPERFLPETNTRWFNNLLDRACSVWGYPSPRRLPLWLINTAAYLCELYATVAGTPSPLTRDFVRIGRVSYGETTVVCGPPSSRISSTRPSRRVSRRCGERPTNEGMPSTRRWVVASRSRHTRRCSRRSADIIQGTSKTALASSIRASRLIAGVRPIADVVNVRR